jgi:hypothetical protein
VLVMEPGSVDAQREVLALLLEYLPERYPRLYTLEGSAHDPGAVLCVHPTGERFCIADYAHCPLEMAARVVQAGHPPSRAACLPACLPVCRRAP